MNIIAIDHVNIQIPKSGVEDALEFYSNILGFKAEQIDEYKKGVRTLFTFRLGENAVLHIRPIDDFSPPDKSNYDHFALIVDIPISEVKSKLSDANMSIMREGKALGSHGRAP